MLHYILKRMLLMIPTLFFILLINFIIVQIAPGGPVEQAVQQIQNAQGLGAGSHSQSTLGTLAQYQGARGLSPEMLEKIKAQYGFDRPAYERFGLMLKGYLTLDFGSSFFKDKPVTQLLYEKLPVTLSLGIWSTFLIYLIAIPLGIKKAKNNGLLFDQSSSLLLAVSYAIPSFVFAILLICFFCRRQLFTMVSVARIGIGKLCPTESIGKNKRLSVAYEFADSEYGIGEFCCTYLSD